MFKDLKRIISQFVECTYWYRLRSKKIECEDYRGRKYFRREYNALKLADTWNGDYSIFSILDMKLTHMLYNLRKYGCESESYIDSGAIIAYGTEQDKKIIWNSIIHQMMNFSNEGCTYIDIFDFSKQVYGKYFNKGAYFKIATIPLDEKRKLLYLEEWNGDNSYGPDDDFGINKHWFEVTLDSHLDGPSSFEDCLCITNIKTFLKDYKNAAFSTINPLDCIGDERFLIHHAVDIPIKLWKQLSPQLMKYIRGNRNKLHSIWKFRKMLRDYQKECEELEESSEFDEEFKKASQIENEVKRYKAYTAALENLYSKKKEIMRQISDYFVQESEKWWD